MAHDLLHEHAEAEQALKEALQIDPNDVKTWIQLGIARAHTQRYNEAQDLRDQISRVRRRRAIGKAGDVAGEVGGAVGTGIIIGFLGLLKAIWDAFWDVLRGG